MSEFMVKLYLGNELVHTCCFTRDPQRHALKTSKGKEVGTVFYRGGELKIKMSDRAVLDLLEEQMEKHRRPAWHVI